MTIALFAPPGARFPRLVADRLTALTGDAPRRFTVEPDGDAPAAVDGAATTWDGMRVDQASAAWITGFRYEDPVLPAAGEDADWSLWQTRHVRRQQGYSFMWSFFSRVEAAGVRLYNPPSALLDLFCRQRPLDVLRARGLPAVSVVVTNDPQVADAVRQRSETTVWRPAAGRAAWQIFRDKQRRHLVGPDKPPVLLAAAEAGVLLRIYTANGAVALALAAAPPAREAVERFERFQTVAPASIAGVDAVGKAAETLGLNWAVFTVLSRPDGLTIYDVDPDPAVDDLPAALRDVLAGALAHALAGRPVPAAPAAETAERDALLLRRMLVIQFEMEATKHAPA